MLCLLFCNTGNYLVTVDYTGVHGFPIKEGSGITAAGDIRVPLLGREADQSTGNAINIIDQLVDILDVSVLSGWFQHPGVTL